MRAKLAQEATMLNPKSPQNSFFGSYLYGDSNRQVEDNTRDYIKHRSLSAKLQKTSRRLLDLTARPVLSIVIV